MPQKGQVYVFVKFRQEYAVDGQPCSLEPVRWNATLNSSRVLAPEYDPCSLGVRIWSAGISPIDGRTLDIVVDEDANLEDLKHRFRAESIGTFTTQDSMIHLHEVSAPVIPFVRAARAVA